jgi:hypothetical protein
MIYRILRMPFLFLTLALFPSLGFAHGTEKPGPHGGFIKMPGGFHTEVLLVNSRTLKVYLLDFNWKNATVKDSSVSVLFVNGGKDTKLNCKPKKSSFECSALNTTFGTHGSFRITANRMNNKGAEVEYNLPLSLMKE